MTGYNFTDGVKSSLLRARSEAATLGHDHVEPVHILVALTGDADSAGPLLRAHGVAADRLLAGFFDLSGPAPTPSPGPELPYTSVAKKVLERAMITARTWGNNWVGVEHLLVGLIEADRGIVRALRAEGVDPEALIAAARQSADRTEGNTVADRIASHAALPSRKEDRDPRSRPVYRAVTIDRTTRAIAIAAFCMALLALVLVLVAL